MVRSLANDSWLQLGTWENLEALFESKSNSGELDSTRLGVLKSLRFERNTFLSFPKDDVAKVEEDEDDEVSAEDASKHEGKIVELDNDTDVTLVDVDAEVEMDTNIQGRMAESQAKAYNLDLQHSEKVLSMQDTDEAEPAEVEEVLKVVTTTKLMTKVVTTDTPITTAAQVPKASAPRRRRGVVIQDPEETTAASVIVHSEIDMDEAFSRQLEAELNANINWNDVIEQVKRSKNQDNTVMRYQALKRKPMTEAQARKNMIIYLKNMAVFKMNFFKGMTYNGIRPLFEKHYNSNQAFLERVEKEVIIQEKEIEEEGSKRKGESLEQDIAKKQRMDEEERREVLETLCMLVKEIFESIELKNFSDDFLLNILKIMFEKSKIMFLLVEKKYPLTHFTLEQMLNNVRLEVKEESEMSLELLRLVRRQLNEGYVPE
uniref:Uncharacterized protein n=1 Tax=Tanacetum cinerariifolium TaxID=118510 RepID=A0A699GYD2_TANCI|nr:hypothetical protein [Tanacetum cinerariifolium]